MPSLTTAVIHYWTQRLAQRIDQKIDQLAAAEPGVRERLAAQARQSALRSLGLEELQTELDALAAQKQQWQQRQRQAQRAMLAVLRRQPLEAVTHVTDEAMQAEIRQAIEQRQASQEEELLAADAWGQHILRLRRERDNLQDTVWLASSPAGLRQLWAKVLHVLDEEPTALQRQALTWADEAADA
jgi:hypothetical protein